MDCDAQETDTEGYWDEFYRKFDYLEPSPFAEEVCSRIDSRSLILDIGCGNGRDSFHFSSKGHQVVGIDISRSAIERNNGIARKNRIPNCRFRCQDVSQLEPFFDLLTQTIDDIPQYNSVIVYSRFFVHAIPEASQITLLQALKKLGRIAPLTCFFEFRTLKDAERKKTFEKHYRRFISLSEFVSSLLECAEMTVIEQREGMGMARFGDEDPWIGRVVSTTRDHAK